MAQEDIFKKLVAHCKEYGYVFQSSEIYDGLAAVYDYGQYGVELKNNIKKYWWDSMVLLHENVVGLDSAIFMHPTIWKASGHVDAFNDPLIDNKDSKKRYRADVLIEDHIAKYDDKIEKDVAKAKKRFGEKFDRILFQKLICHIRNLALCFGSLSRVMNAECNDHLVFPKRNGVDECGLDLFGHYRIAVLNHADLRRCLDRNHTGQFQIIQFLLKSVAEIFEILGSLCVFGLSM